MDVTSLQESLNVLQLLYQRNKNQHRRAIWWKWFSLLRRNVENLLCEEDANLVQRARIRYLNDALIPKCYKYVTQREKFRPTTG